MAYFLSVLGLVLILEGLPYFASPDKMKQLLGRMLSAPATQLRIFGAAATIIGLLLIFFARKIL